MTEKTTTEIIAEKLVDKFDVYLNEATKVISKYTPDAIDAAFLVLRIEILQAFFISFVALIACIITVKVFLKYQPKVSRTTLLRAVSKSYGQRRVREDSAITSYFKIFSSDFLPLEGEELKEFEEKLRQEESNQRDWVNHYSFFAIVPVVLAIAVTNLFVKYIFNLWMWIGLWHPELYAIWKFVLK